MSNTNKGLMLILSTAIISGLSVFINKFGVAVNNPNIFTFAKNITVAILLTAVIIFFKKHRELFRLKQKQWLQLVLLGLAGGSIPFLLFFRGLALTSAAQGAFIHKTMFIFVALLAVIFLKEKINKNFLIGGLLLMLGNLLTLKSFNFSFGLGDGLILLAVLFWAAENTLAKYALRELPGNIVAWGRMFFGSILIFLYLLFIGQTPQILSLNWGQLGWIIVTSILLFGYVTTWYNGLKSVPVSVATTILLLGLPITTLFTAVNANKLILKDAYSGALILSGVILVIGMDWIWKQIKNIKRHVRT